MKDYFYIDSNNEQKGPISPLNFSIYNITPDTLVWCEGMADWTRAGSVDELHDVFVTQQTQATPPPYANNGGGYNQQQAQSFQQPQQTMQPCPDSNLVWATYHRALLLAIWRCGHCLCLQGERSICRGRRSRCY